MHVDRDGDDLDRRVTALVECLKVGLDVMVDGRSEDPVGSVGDLDGSREDSKGSRENVDESW